MASRLTKIDHLTHDCAEEIQLRQDLQTEPLINPDLTLDTDGCCYKGHQGNVTFDAIVKQKQKKYKAINEGIIPQSASIQLAKFLALTKAPQCSVGLRANIYSDSAYTHGAVHVDNQKLVRSFQTTASIPMKHRDQLEELIRAVMLPTEVAVKKCKGHH